MMTESLRLIRENKGKVLVFFCSLAFAARSLVKDQGVQETAVTLTFYLTALLFACWAGGVCALLARDRDKLAGFFRKNAGGFLFSLLLAAAIFLLVRPEMRVYNDEPQLLTVSYSMLSRQQVGMFEMALPGERGLQPLGSAMDKRPFAFPFSVFLAHALTGYRAENAFAVNFLAAWALFCAVFAFFRALYGPLPAFSAVLLAASQPALQLSAASAGMDLMSVLFLFLSFVALRAYLEKSDAASFGALWGTLLLFANIRYENSVLAVIAAAGLLLAGRLRAGHLASWPAALTPLLLLPVLWQRLFFVTDFANAPGEPAFSVSYFFINLAACLNAHLPLSLYYPYNAAVAAAAAAGAGWYALAGGAVAPEKKLPLRIALAALGAYCVILLLYYAGNASLPKSARLFLPLELAISLAAAASLSEMAERRRKELLAFAAAAFLLYLPVAARNSFFGSYCRDYVYQAGAVKELGGGKLVVVSLNPVTFAAMGRGSVSFDYAIRNSAALLDGLKRKAYDRVIVFQEFDRVTGKRLPGTELGREYRLFPITGDVQVLGKVIRLSEVRL